MRYRSWRKSFVYVAAFGSFTDTSCTTPQLKNIFGAAYIYGAAKLYKALRPYKIRVNTTVVSLRAILFTV